MYILSNTCSVPTTSAVVSFSAASVVPEASPPVVPEASPPVVPAGVPSVGGAAAAGSGLGSSFVYCK